MDSDRTDVRDPSTSGGGEVGSGEEGSTTLEAEEGTRREWDVVPSSEVDVEGVDDPKVVHWEQLQQELARFWSLSSALKQANEKKQALSQCILSIIEMRSQSLSQTYKLEDMRQKLEAMKLAALNFSLDTKIDSEDTKNDKEQLDSSFRSLSVAAKRIDPARSKLQDTNELLQRDGHYGYLKGLRRVLRMRQQYMINQVSALYTIESLSEQLSTSDKPRESTGLPSPESLKSSHSLTIAGLPLTTLPLKKMSLFSGKKEMQRYACALGYVAHAVSLIASYLDVPLRYHLRLGGSRSYIQDLTPSVESTSELVLNPLYRSTSGKLTEFPLFFEGQDATRAAYAVFLLNKDLEQILNYIGAESLGPRHVLANLKEIYRLAESEEFIDK